MEKGLSNIYELLLLKVGCGVDEIHCVQTVIPRLILKSFYEEHKKTKHLDIVWRRQSLLTVTTSLRSNWISISV